MQSKGFVNPKHEWCRHRAKSRTDPLEGGKADLFSLSFGVTIKTALLSCDKDLKRVDLTSQSSRSRCMSIRTQVYLTDQERQRIDELAESEGVTMAEIIRRALDGFLDEQPDPQPALAATFGAAPDAIVPSRDEWDRG